MTVPPQGPHNPPPRSDVTETLFAPLSTRECDVLIAALAHGWRLTAAVHGLFSPLFVEMRETMYDAHRAWVAAYEREHDGDDGGRPLPGRLKAAAR